MAARENEQKQKLRGQKGRPAPENTGAFGIVPPVVPVLS